MKGNVQGFPIAVPMAEDMIFDFNNHAQIPPIMKCNPTKGENETAAPHANPAAI